MTRSLSVRYLALAKAVVLYAAMLAIELVLALAAGMWAARSSA